MPTSLWARGSKSLRKEGRGSLCDWPDLETAVTTLAVSTYTLSSHRHFLISFIRTWSLAQVNHLISHTRSRGEERGANSPGLQSVNSGTGTKLGTAVFCSTSSPRLLSSQTWASKFPTGSHHKLKIAILVRLHCDPNKAPDKENNCFPSLGPNFSQSMKWGESVLYSMNP